MRGKHISFSGVNNVGKTTQCLKLVEWLKKTHEVSYAKFPGYEIEPFGPVLYRLFHDAAYRQAHSDSYPQDKISRMLHDNILGVKAALEERLSQGLWIVMDGSALNGVAWAACRGTLELEAARALYADVVPEDITILLHERHGRRFREAIHPGHMYEEYDDIMERVRVRLAELSHEDSWNCERIDFSVSESETAVFCRILGALAQRGLV